MTTMSAGKLGAVVEPDAGDMGLAQDRMGVRLAAHGDAAILERLLQQVAGRGIELALHQGRHEMENRDLHALGLQARRRLEPEQAAADDDGMPALPGRFEHLVDVVEVAVGDHARQGRAGDRHHEGHRAGGDEEPVVVRRRSVRCGHTLAGAVDLDDLLAAMKRDAVRLVPGIVVDQDVLIGLFAGEDGREHDAVVVHPRLGAEDGHVVCTGSALEQLLQGTACGHAVADDDKLLGHLSLPEKVKNPRGLLLGTRPQAQKRRLK